MITQTRFVRADLVDRGSGEDTQPVELFDVSDIARLLNGDTRVVYGRPTVDNRQEEKVGFGFVYPGEVEAFLASKGRGEESPGREMGVSYNTYARSFTLPELREALR